MPSTTTRAYPRTYSYSYFTASQSAAVAATATVSAAGSVTFLGTATRPVTATVSAGGSVTVLGSASVPVAAAVSAGGSVTVLGSATRPVTATVAAAGSVTFLGSASVPVAAAVSAAGSVVPVLSGGSAVSVSAAVAATGAVGTGGLAALGWVATISAAGSLTLTGGTSVPVAATISAAGSVTFLGTSARPVTVTVAAAGLVAGVGGVSVAVTATVAAAGFSVELGAASVGVDAAVSAAGLVLPLLNGDVRLSWTAAVSATGYASGGASVISGGAMPWTFYADSAVAPFTDIGPVEVVAFTAGWQLSGFGSGEATIAVSRKSALTRAMLMQLWTWRLWAFYQGQPVWAGCPTGVIDQGNQTVTVSLSELTGYLEVKQYALNHTYTGAEQCTIARDLASPLSNIGVAIATQPGAGQNRDRTYTFLQSSRAQMLTDLSQVISGPEFRSEYAAGSGGVGASCTLRIAYPRVGQASGLAVVVPHGAISFRTTWAADMMRTRTFAVGDLAPNAPTTATKPVVTIVAPQAGVPELDHVDDWPGVSVASTLNEYASSYSQSYAQAALSLEVVMPLMSPLLGTYLVGDDVAVSLADPLVPAGLNATGRLTALQLDAATGTVTWTVSITLPHPRPYASLSAQLTALHRKTAGIFHNSLAAPPGGINP